jgi:Mor family transcriptional regulator
VELNEGHKRAIVQMFAHGARIADLAKWYKTDPETIREVLRPHVKMGVETARGR